MNLLKLSQRTIAKRDICLHCVVWLYVWSEEYLDIISNTSEQFCNVKDIYIFIDVWKTQTFSSHKLLIRTNSRRQLNCLLARLPSAFAAIFLHAS